MNNTINTVLSIKKVDYIIKALTFCLNHNYNYKNLTKEEYKELNSMDNLVSTFMAETLKSTDNFVQISMSMDDCIVIAKSCRSLWDNKKSLFYSNYKGLNEQQSRNKAKKLHKNRKYIISIIDTATGNYMSLCPNVKKGTAFRSLYYVPSINI